MRELTKLRVAVLECAEPADAIQEHEGSYGDMFGRLLQTGLDELLRGKGENIELFVSKWPIVERQEYPNPEEVDAILLSGSQYDAFDNTPWITNVIEYVRNVICNHPRTRLVGICFGHQIVARALGSRVVRNTEGWEIAVDKIDLTENGKEIFGVDALSLHQMHRDIVYELPTDCINLGYSSRCQIQGFYRAQKLLTVQGHPEFNEFIMNFIIDARYKRNVFTDELYHDGKSRAGLKHDGVIVGTAICKFLLFDKL